LRVSRNTASIPSVLMCHVSFALALGEPGPSR
jgi:hypothetical protein